MAGKWSRYADKFGLDIGAFFNKSIRRALKVGVQALVANTVHDSSRAAFHWVVIPSGGNVRPGAWREMTFNPAYGHPPVGRRGDKGANKGETVAFVTEREFDRAIDATVRAPQPATRFVFSNSTPDAYDDRKGEFDPETRRRGDMYRVNAKLERAKEAAEARMQTSFSGAIQRGELRKRPL